MRDACGCEVVAWKKGATYRCGGGEFWQKDFSPFYMIRHKCLHMSRILTNFEGNFQYAKFCF